MRLTEHLVRAVALLVAVLWLAVLFLSAFRDPIILPASVHFLGAISVAYILVSGVETVRSQRQKSEWMIPKREIEGTVYEFVYLAIRVITFVGLCIGIALFLLGSGTSQLVEPNREWMITGAAVSGSVYLLSVMAHRILGYSIRRKFGSGGETIRDGPNSPRR